MERPDYDKILKDKIEHYGETKAAYQFAAEELARKEGIKVVYNRCMLAEHQRLLI